MLSIIIINHNGKEHLEACLKSLAAQTLGQDEFEVILVDNGSTDGSVSYLETNFPAVRVVGLGENTGFSRAANAGFRASLGELAVFLNNDTEARPDWLSELKRAAEEHKDFAFFASKMLFFDRRDVIDSAGDVFSALGHGVKRGHGQKDAGQFDKEEEVFGACGGAAMYSRQAFLDAGGFDEKFFAYCEDVDLSFRLRKAGHKCLFVPKAVVYHKLGGTAKVHSDTHIYYTQRNQEIVLRKHAAKSARFLHFLYNIYSFLRHLLRGKAGVFIRAKIDAGKLMKEYAGEIDLSSVTESSKDGKKETEALIGKLASASFGDFFITAETAANLKGFLNASGLSAEVLAAADKIVSAAKAASPAELAETAKAFWLTGGKKYLNLYIRELNRFLDAPLPEASGLFYYVYGYYFVKDAALPYELKKKYASRLNEAAKDPVFSGAEAPAANKAALFMLSLAFPFILKFQYNDVFEKLTAETVPGGVVAAAAPEKSFELLEALTVFLLLLRLRRKVEEKEFFLKTRKLFEFCLAFVRPDGEFPVKQRAFLLPSKKADLSYLLFLKALAENGWDELSGGGFAADYLFFGGSFSAEERELKPPRYKVEHLSAGFPASRIYIMKNRDNYTFTGYRSSEIYAGGTLLSSGSGRTVTLDDSMIVYDKHERTNLWAAGREFDILDLQYEITPSITHRRQIYFNKKEAFWVFREKFYGSEQHNVKLRFFPERGSINDFAGQTSKQLIRDCINKFNRASKLDTTLLKLNAEDSLAYTIKGRYLLVPLNNPGMEKRSDGDWTGYTANVLFPNEFTFLLLKN